MSERTDERWTAPTDGFTLYASSPTDPRSRRPVDALRAVAYLLLVLTAAVLDEIGGDIDRELSGVLTSFPGFLRLLWLGGFWGAFAWSLALVAIAVTRGRLRLAVAGLGGAALAVVLAVLAAAAFSGDTGDVLARLVDLDGPPVFPPAALAITSAVIATMAPYLTLPFRRVGRVLVLAQAVGALFLGSSQTLGAVASIAIGLLAGTAVHLVIGSPGGIPTVGRVERSLRDLGVDVVRLEPLGMDREGVARLRGDDVHGPIEVKVYGRDAWEGELLASMWRRAWYRGTGQRDARLRRDEYVEHEGFMSFLAGRAGVQVPEVVTAGVADDGDALIVLRPAGQALSAVDPTLSADQARALWAELARLHAARIAHRRIDLDRVVRHADGTAGFGDLSSATVRATDPDEHADRAQMLALTMLACGRDTGVEQARVALGDDVLVAALPYLQEVALPPLVRSAVRERHVDVDDVRTELEQQLGAPETELVPLRRVTWRSLLNLVLVAVAAYTLIGMIADLDLGAFARSLGDANWWWLATALVIGQLPRVANAVSTMGSTTHPLPLGPTTALHFATCYVNLSVPSSAGRIAITTRFFQRFGVPPASALSAGVIDSVSEFTVQLGLFALMLFVSDVDLGLSLSTDQLSGLATTALLVVGALVVAAVVALAVPSVRQRLRTWFGEAREALTVLRTPRKLLQLFGGNLLSQVLFAVALSACVRGMGYEVPLSALILINTVVSLFAGLLPVPGGVGVSEAGLSLGLTRAGIPAEEAFAIALTFRFCTYYLPPIWGFRSYRWLAAHRYL